MLITTETSYTNFDEGHRS